MNITGQKSTLIRPESSAVPSFSLYVGRPILSSAGLLTLPAAGTRPYHTFPWPVIVCRARTLLALAAALLCGCSHIEPLVMATHASDPTDAGVSDTTVDFIGAGITATFGGVSIDAAFGRKAINCAAFAKCPSTPGAVATLRWNPSN